MAAMQNLFFRRPRLLVLTLGLIVVAGLSALEVLPRREDPELVTRNALIVTRYPGANAERVETQVTEKIEDELRELEELSFVESFSRAGASVISVEILEEITEVDLVWSKLRDKLDDAEDELPPGASSPEFEESTITAFTLVTGLAWELPGEPNLAILGRLAEDLEDALLAVPGTKDVELYGEPTEEIRVTLESERLSALGLTPADLARALERGDAKVPAGLVRGSERDLLIEVEGEFETLERVAAVPVRTGEDGELVRLGDVATVEKTVTDPPSERATVTGRPGVLVAARMQSGLRVDRWAEDAHAALAAFGATLPTGIELEVLFDQRGYTDDRLALLTENLALAAVLVLLVVFVTMGWRSGLLVGAALPLTVLSVLALLRILGVPLHQMSVTGLIIALGLLIDNAIVMADELRHRLDAGDSVADAVGNSVRMLAVPLLGSTVTTVLAFMPLLLSPGAVGEFVGAMSLSVVLAVTSSFLLSLTVLPALAGWLERLRPAGTESSFWRNGIASGPFLPAYRALLRQTLARPWLGVGLALLLPILGFGFGSNLQEQFFPPAGRDQVQVELRLPEGTPIERTLAETARATASLLADGSVTAASWVVGGSAPKFYYNMLESEEGSPHYAQALVQLERADDVVAVVRDLQMRLDRALPETQALVRRLEQGPPFEAPIELRLHGPDLARLQELGETVRAELARLPDVTQTRATLSTGRPKLFLRADDDELAGAGLDRVGLAERLSTALEGVHGGSLFEGGEELPVRVRLDDVERRSTGRVADLELATAGDGWTTVASLGSWELVPEPGSIPRRDGRRMNEILGFVAAGTLAADTLDGLMAGLDRSGFTLPPGYSLEVAGESAERDEAVGRLAASASVLVLLMVATLVLSLSSFRMAAVIGGVAFFSVGLSLGALWLFGHPFGFMAIVGAMGLVGIAINDSIVVLAALRADAGAARGEPDAALGVVVRSTRHVLSTTVTTVVGFTPLVFAQDGLWPPLAVAIAGGVVGATLLALFFVPSAFLLVTERERAATADVAELTPVLA